MKRIVFLASGKGSNFEAVVDSIKRKSLDIETLGLICNKKDAKVLEKANQFGIKSILIPSDSNPEFSEQLFQTLTDLNPDLIVLAGYMKILPTEIIQAFPNKIINIHPSLLPAFPGLKSIEKAFEYGVQYTGCTVHFVDEGVDSGAIILQSVVEILPTLSISELTEIIHQEEHKILPLAVQYFCEGRISVEGRKVIIRDDKNKKSIGFGQ